MLGRTKAPEMVATGCVSSVMGIFEGAELELDARACMRLAPRVAGRRE